MSDGPEEEREEKTDGEERERDPVLRLPAPPRPKLNSNPSQGERAAWKLRYYQWERTVDCLIAVKRLYQGKLNESDYLIQKEVMVKIRSFVERNVQEGLPPGPSLFFEDWDSSPSHIRELVTCIQQAVERAYPEVPKLCGETALARLSQVPTGGYGAGLVESISTMPAKGATTP